MKINVEHAFTKALWVTIALHVLVWAWTVFFSFSRSTVIADSGGDVLEIVDAGPSAKDFGIGAREEKLLAALEPEPVVTEQPQVSHEEVIPEPIVPQAKESIVMPEAIPVVKAVVKKEPPKKKPIKKPIKKEPPKLEQVSYEKFMQKYGKKVVAKASSMPKKQGKKSTLTSSVVHPKVSISGVGSGLKGKSENVGSGKVGQMAGKGGQGSGGGNGGNGVANALSQYISNIRGHIEEAWASQEVSTQGLLKATVCFKVTGLGKISDCKIITPSKDPNFDRILLALFSQLPLLPPPDNCSHAFQLTFEQGE